MRHPARCRSTSRKSLGILAACAFLAAADLACASAPPDEEAAKKLVRAARAWQDLRTYTDTTDFSASVDTPELKQERDFSFQVALQRPNLVQLRSSREGAAMAVISDGKTVWMYDAATNTYFEREAPPSFDDVFTAQTRGPEASPFVDLTEPLAFLSYLLGESSAGARDSWRLKGLGRDASGLEGIQVEDPERKWQARLWIGASDGLVRKIEAEVNLSRFEPPPEGAAPARELKVRIVEVHDHLKCNEKLDASVFAFTPPEGARKITLAEAEAESRGSGGSGGNYTFRVDVVEPSPPRALEPGEPREAAYADMDDLSVAAVPPYDLWCFSADKKGTLRVSLDSDDSDPVLYHLSSPEDLLEDALVVDDDSGSGMNAVLFVDVDAGQKCFFAAARKYLSPAGTYRILAVWNEPAAAPRIREISLGESHEGALTWGCAQRPNHVAYDVWTFKAREDVLVSIQVQSGDFIPTVRVHREGLRSPVARNYEPEMLGTEINAAVHFTAPKESSFKIEVASFEPGEIGKYKISADRSDLPEAPKDLAAVELGKMKGGEASAGSKGSVWRLAAERPTRVFVRASSRDFSPSLRLHGYHPYSSPLAKDDSMDNLAGFVADLFPGIPYYLTVGPLAREEPFDAGFREEVEAQLEQYVGTPAPAVTFKDLDGKDVPLQAQRGKVVLLDFWATWCPPCRKEIPHFKEISQAYPGRVEILGVSDEEESALREFRAENSIPYKLLASEADMPEPFSSVAMLPTTFVIDKKGIIRSVHEGYREKSAFVEEIEKLLKED